MTRTKERRMLPRFAGSRHQPDAFARGLPDRLLDAMDAAAAPEVARFRTISANYEKAQEKTVEIVAKLAQVKRDDERKRADALAEGRQRPAPRAEKIELDLRQAREDVAILSELLRDCADELLAAAVPFAAEAYAAAERDASAAVESVRELLAATADAVEDADRLAGESGWIGSLVKTGIVWPWSPGTSARTLPNVKQHLGHAIGSFSDDVQRVEDHRDAREREEAAALPLAPGSIVWEGERTLVVREDGELEEVER